ncbi:hypothetical protein FRC17_000416 [Serendipita sp. 399]|nr:hypothetical protein FRC17_000416 [Serendipita sp. 399]
MEQGHQGQQNILWNHADWASFQDQSPSSNGKDEGMFLMDIASPVSFETNAMLDPASMSMLDTLLQQIPSGTPSMPDPMSFSTAAHINIPPRPSGIALQLKNHQYDMSFVPTSLPDMQNQYTRGDSVGTSPSLTYSPESRRSDSVGFSLSPRLDVACQHTHLRHDSAGSLTMNYMWPARPSTATGCGNSPMLDTGSLLTSPMFTGVGNEQLIPVDEMPASPTRPVTIPGMNTSHARKQSRSSQIVSGNGSGSSLGIVRTSAGSNNRPQPYPSHNRSSSYTSSPLAIMTHASGSLSPYPHTSGSLSPHLQMELRRGASSYGQTLSPMIETNDGMGLFFDGFTSAPPENISTGGSLNANLQLLPRRRIKAQGDGGDAPVSLEEFTSAQRPAAEAILAYQREHPDTAIPTTYFTSALVEIKDGKGRCLVGSCALEQLTTLKRVDHLYEHVRDRHFGCKPHKCDSCAQRFSRENDLKRHQSVHVRDIQACPVCNNEYSRFDNLKRHVKDKHPEYNLQPSTSAGSRNFGRSQLALRLPAKLTL